MKTVGYVYFVGSTDGPIKIGYSVDPRCRLFTIQSDSPIELRILATLPGGWQREAAYHAQFAHLRIRGEWFERAPDLLDEVDRLKRRARLDERRRVRAAADKAASQGLVSRSFPYHFEPIDPRWKEEAPAMCPPRDEGEGA